MSAHTTETQLKLIGKLLLEGELHCEAGLHVGAGNGWLEIGSSDNPVIKDAFGRPYIPGSSRRRRLRSLLEEGSRLTAYDAPLDPESITPQMRENLDGELTEVKSENAVDRITSQANPRTLERAPAGAKFKFRMVMDVLCEEEKPLVARLAEGLRLLEDDALGGGGSRGNGRVGFAGLNLAWRGKDYY